VALCYAATALGATQLYFTGVILKRKNNLPDIAAGRSWLLSAITEANAGSDAGG